MSYKAVAVAPFHLVSNILRRAQDSPSSSEFLVEWKNPSDVLSVVLIIGGDTVRVALAQLAGNSFFVPVCFSFGWVAFGFFNFMRIAGDGKLMPEIDYPCKVFNADTGYGRECRSWMLGRLLRDNEEDLTDESIYITIWEARGGVDGNPMAGHGKHKSWVWWMSLGVMISQIIISSIPWILYGDYGVFLITVVGTLLALITGSLPQWRAEKYACRGNNSSKSFIITAGNGSRHAMLIKGNAGCLDFEDLAMAEGPRSYRTWKNYVKIKNSLTPPDLKNAKTYTQKEKIGNDTMKKPTIIDKLLTKSAPGSNMPLAYHYTRVISIFLAIAWILLLICVSAIHDHAWYLLLVGAIGLLQNVFTAGYKQNLTATGLHMVRIGEVSSSGKVMHALMKLEENHPGSGSCLLPEFFPGKLSPAEEAWWDKKEFDLATAKYTNAKEQARQYMAVPDVKILERKWGGSADTWAAVYEKLIKDKEKAEGKAKAAKAAAQSGNSPTEPLSQVVVVGDRQAMAGSQDPNAKQATSISMQQMTGS